MLWRVTRSNQTNCCEKGFLVPNERVNRVLYKPTGITDIRSTMLRYLLSNAWILHSVSTRKVYVLHPYSRIGTTTGLYTVQSVLRSKPDGVASQILYSWPLTLSSRSWCKRLKFNLRLWKKFLPDNSSCSPLYSVSVDRALFFHLALTMTLLLSLLIFISYAYELFHSNDW